MPWRQYAADGGLKTSYRLPPASVSVLGAVELDTDLGNSANIPWVVGLNGSALPAMVADGFLKRDSGNTAWQWVPYGSTANTVCQGNDPRLLAGIESSEGYLRCKLSTADSVTISFAPVSGTAYFTFLGRASTAFTPQYVRFQVATAGSGAQTAEVGLFSTANPPNRSNQTLTKIVATGTISALTSTGVKNNTAAFATSVAAGTYLWAGVRLAMATTQPACVAVIHDMEQGEVLYATASGALTAGASFSGVVNLVSVTPSVSGIDLSATLT